MKFKYTLLSAAVSTLLVATNASAVSISGGNGVGYQNNTTLNTTTNVTTTGPNVVNMVFSKADLKKGTVGEVYSGMDTTTYTDAFTQAQAIAGNVQQIAGRTRSMGWCDPSAVNTPTTVAAGDFENCYGWAMFSRWVVIDLNALQKGNSNVWVTITAERYDDGVASETVTTGGVTKAEPSDDDLIPALTVWQGRQDEGVHYHYFPNRFQQNPFWAWKLTPFAGGKTQSTGWATAYGTPTQDKAEVVGKFQLKPGNQNYLSVVVGGDARTDASLKHEANYKLSVKVTRKKPN